MPQNLDVDVDVELFLVSSLFNGQNRTAPITSPSSTSRRDKAIVMIVVLLLIFGLIIGIYVIFFTKKKKVAPRSIQSYMEERQQKLKTKAKQKMDDTEDISDLIQDYTVVAADCVYKGPVPTPKEMGGMDEEVLRALENCGALRSILVYWAIENWLMNAVEFTKANFIRSMTCVIKLLSGSELYKIEQIFQNFDEFVKACIRPTTDTKTDIRYILQIQPPPRPTQWVFDSDGSVRPWQPVYPSLPTPTVPLSLFGTSNR